MTPEATQQPPAISRREYRRILTSSFIGSTVEFYDFLLYGTAAALVFGPVFFTGLSPAAALTAAFATFTVGYIARPLGGIIFGHMGDRVGRKATLITTMLMMGVSSTLMGVLPTADQVGHWAPLLLLTLRITQGLAVGGEWGGSALIALEHAPDKKRGLAASVANMGGPAGAMLATLVFAGVTLLPEDDLMSWGWRIPFLISSILVAVALYIRLNISESPVFIAAQQKATELKKNRAPAVELFAKYRGVLIVTVIAGIAAMAYSNFMGTFAISIGKEGGLSSSQVLICKAGAAFIHIFTIAFFAKVSDRYGRRQVMLVGVGLSILGAFPLMMLLSSGSVPLVLAGFLIGNPLIQGALYGPLAAYISERFPTRVRYTGAGLTYQLATVAASFTPMISAVLWGLGRDNWAAGWSQYSYVAAYLIGATIVSGIAIMLTPDTRSVKLNDHTSEKSANPEAAEKVS